jgi:hypothetical protein
MVGAEEAEAAHRVRRVHVEAGRRADPRDVRALQALEDGIVEAGVARHVRPP